MAQKDKIKWDKKYKENQKLQLPRDPSKKLVSIVGKIKGKNALDIACGTGRNSLYLAKNNFKVEALDISQVAIDILTKENHPNIKTTTIDLEGFTPSKNCYDIIIMTNYLDRDIIHHLSQALKKEGFLIIETYMDHENNTKPDSNPDFLLKKDELKSFFDDKFKIVEYDEFDNEPYELYKMKKQSIIVQRVY
ncbi:MAG: methyltransferase domain-containing protein [Campylobacterota bacterium]|nr:methyltransferase domain-containing protein [Campylobacterota bacterium]